MPKLKTGQYLYDNGLPFSSIIFDNLVDLFKRVENNKASLIICDGLMGEGKTTLAVQLMHAYSIIHKNGKLDGTNFYELADIDLRSQLAMGGDEFQERLLICHKRKLCAITYDEAGDFSKRGAITAFNARLNRIFQTFRAFKIIIIMALPCFDILDSTLFLQGIPRILLNCHGRNQQYGRIRGYGLTEMFYLKNHMKKEVVPITAYQKIVPNFRGIFLNLPPELSALVDKISTESKLKELNDEKRKKPMPIGQIDEKYKGWMGYKEMAYTLGVGLNTVIMTSSGKPFDVVRTAKMFSPETIAIIKKEIEEKRKKKRK